MVRRWRELPLDRALDVSGTVRELVDELALRTSEDGGGRPRQPAARVPDLGPAVLVDQLRVLVHDAHVAAGGEPPGLAERLRGLRLRIG